MINLCFGFIQCDVFGAALVIAFLGSFDTLIHFFSFFRFWFVPGRTFLCDKSAENFTRKFFCWFFNLFKSLFLRIGQLRNLAAVYSTETLSKNLQKYVDDVLLCLPQTKSPQNPPAATKENWFSTKLTTFHLFSSSHSFYKFFLMITTFLIIKSSLI